MTEMAANNCSLAPVQEPNRKRNREPEDIYDILVVYCIKVNDQLFLQRPSSGSQSGVLFLLLNVVTPQKPATLQYHSDGKAAMKTNADPLLNQPYVPVQ